jgi:hypothetical protein
MDCWIVIAARKLQNFAVRSYRFARTVRVFHAKSSIFYHPGRTPAFEACRPWRESTAGGRDDQLTCRDAAPKTRHQFNGVNGPSAAFREEFNA